MTKQQFLFFTVIISLETYFLNTSIFEKDWFASGFFGILLVRQLQKVYVISKVTDNFLNAKKKD